MSSPHKKHQAFKEEDFFNFDEVNILANEEENRVPPAAFSADYRVRTAYRMNIDPQYTLCYFAFLERYSRWKGSTTRKFAEPTQLFRWPVTMKELAVSPLAWESPKTSSSESLATEEPQPLYALLRRSRNRSKDTSGGVSNERIIDLADDDEALDVELEMKEQPSTESISIDQNWNFHMRLREITSQTFEEALRTGRINFLEPNLLDKYLVKVIAETTQNQLADVMDLLRIFWDIFEFGDKKNCLTWKSVIRAAKLSGIEKNILKQVRIRMLKLFPTEPEQIRAKRNRRIRIKKESQGNENFATLLKKFEQRVSFKYDR